MVKIPQEMKAYCRSCRTHVTMKVKQEKVGRRGGGMSKVARTQRRKKRGYGNQGKYSKKPVTQTKMASKTSKKVNLRVTCPTCGKTYNMNRPRTKRVEMLRVHG